jgi:beta-phosphoglucomutase-like phosphatase (HAD superfamily)
MVNTPDCTSRSCYTVVMIQAVIFDMDGVLIDSEPLWQEAENEIFGSLGVPVSNTLSAETTGMSTSQTVEYWHQRFPWSKPSLAEVGEQIGTVNKYV